MKRWDKEDWIQLIFSVIASVIVMVFMKSMNYVGIMSYGEDFILSATLVTFAWTMIAHRLRKLERKVFT